MEHPQCKNDSGWTWGLGQKEKIKKEGEESTLKSLKMHRSKIRYPNRNMNISPKNIHNLEDRDATKMGIEDNRRRKILFTFFLELG